MTCDNHVGEPVHAAPTVLARVVRLLVGGQRPETLGELLEKIVLHSFDPVPGDEGESSASPHGKAALKAIEDLKKVYGLDYDTHRTRTFPKESTAD